MAPFDIVLAILLIFGAFSGFKRGFILEFVSLVSFIVASLAAFHFMNLGAEIISRHTANLGAALPIVAFVSIFIIVFFAIVLLGKIIKGIVHLTPFGTLDSLLGLGFGLFKWALFISLAVWLVNSFDPEVLRVHIENTKLYPHIENWGNIFIAYSLEYFPVVQNFIDSYQLAE